MTPTIKKNKNMPLQKTATLFIGIILLTNISVSQTASDTASIIGTSKRSIPNITPTKPEPPESLSSPPSAQNGAGKEEIPVGKIKKDEKSVASKNESGNAVEKAYENSLIAYYKAIEKKGIADAKTIDSVGSYYMWALNNRKEVISRQQFTGNIIFILVSILLLSGLTFSAIQFRIALKNAKKKNTDATDTTFKASLAGIEVSSSILGVIILVISLAFFYLYLTNVYPLVSLDQSPTQMPK